MPSNIQRLRVLSEKLIETESALSAFWHLAPNMFSVTTRDGKFVKVNDAWYRIMGHSPADIIGTETRALIHPDDLQSAIDARANAFKHGFLKDFKCRFRHKDGHYVLLNWNSTLIFSDKYIYAIAQEVKSE